MEIRGSAGVRQMRRRRSLVIHSRYRDRQHRNVGQWLLLPSADIIVPTDRQSSFARRKTMQAAHNGPASRQGGLASPTS